jgi:serine/threonine protein kinase/beta-lactam-binding protein with PASTA domain
MSRCAAQRGSQDNLESVIVQTATGDRLIGRVLEGRYRVLERLARGGMSTVYSALDERLDREVAVKVMSAALSTDPAFADRFAREARVAARLSHLNAVAVYDQGTDDGHVFLVMELVRGRTLRDLIREQRQLSPAQAVSILEPVLGALAAAHRAGLVHRDIKPENILLADDGVVKVADFGLARAIESDASNTRTGLMMGTVAYCPPEQISRGNADARSDVYSAGVVLFELLTGSTPYVGDSAMAVAYQHVNSDVPAPSSRRSGLPTQLDDVVLRATSREPSGRPLDAGALLAELHDVRLDLGLPVVAVPPRPRADQPIDATQPIAAVPAGNPMSPVSPLVAPAEATTAPNPAAPVFDPLQNTVIGERPMTPGPPQAAQGQPVKRGKRPLSRKARARRRAAIVVLIILLLGALTGYGAWWLAVGRYHEVPQLSGLSQAAATKRLSDGGFSVSSAVNRQFSETVAAGTVLGTDPSAGSHLLSGKSVTLIVSKGQERYKVPAVSGTFDQARQTLQTIPEVQVTQQLKADDTGNIASGQVMGTDPAAGISVKRGQAIIVFVSSGPPSVDVPDVKGKKKDEAESKLTDAGFKVGFSEDYSDTVPEGRVISQSPDTGSAVKFSTVSVVVSKGPPLVTIPEITNGTNADDAKAQLEGLGLKVKIDKQFGGFLNQVVAMDPKAGQQVPKGTEVKLTVV